MTDETSVITRSDSEHALLQPGETACFGNVTIKNNGTIPVYISDAKDGLIVSDGDALEEMIRHWKIND